jgi:N6-L-threonylcarbamoyladenine synthase
VCPPDAESVSSGNAGAGLLGSLLVGTVTARGLASIHEKRLIGVHHTLGHLSSTWLDASPAPAFPLLTLSASGGHTDLWYRTSHTRGVLLGRTRDDAAGEAFDKGASMLGLGYPGGPLIAKAAENGRYDAFPFPLPLKGEDTLDYSFSGLKTSLKYLLRDHADAKIADVAASFEHAICVHLLDGLRRAAKKYPDVREIHIVGGVSANTHLRALADQLSQELPGKPIIRTPKTLAYCTDNAAMIAAAGEFLYAELGDHALATFETAASLPLSAVITG